MPESLVKTKSCGGVASPVETRWASMHSVSRHRAMLCPPWGAGFTAEGRSPRRRSCRRPLSHAFGAQSRAGHASYRGRPWHLMNGLPDPHLHGSVSLRRSNGMDSWLGFSLKADLKSPERMLVSCP